MGIGDGSFIFGLFGGRRLIGCKESNPCGGPPIDPWRLATDKALDYAMLQPMSIQYEGGTVDALTSWGVPMDGSAVPPVLPYSFYAHPSDGTDASAPLSIGAEARSMAASAMADVRSVWQRRR